MPKSAHNRPAHVFLDMDGVLADFVGGICLAHGAPNPYYNILPYQINCLAAGNWDVWDLITSPWVTGKMTLEHFYSKCDYHFWTKLERTPEAHHIVSHVVAAFGLKNITVMTSPTRNEGCMEGKLAWLDEHYPALADAVYFERNKAEHAYPNGLLIDDSDKNCESWRAAGGQAILVPRPWNMAWRFNHQCVEAVVEGIKTYKRSVLAGAA